MKRGKQTCRILKDIRRQIAEANDIEFITSECQYQGDCLGTCPKCEAEVRYLEQQLERKRMAGKVVTILGISTGMLTLAPIQSTAQESKCVVAKDSIVVNDTTTVKTENAIFGEIVETMPSFPQEGDKGLKKYITENLKYPDPQICITGRVIVSFTVKKDGSIADAKVLRSIHPLFDQEALRVINSMPKWNPGKRYDRPIDVRFTVPIVFNQLNPKYLPAPNTFKVFETSKENSKKEPVITIKGRVIDNEGNPIIGAQICESGKENNGTLTDSKGTFKLDISRKHSLIISYIGMKTLKVKVKKFNSPYICASLQNDNSLLMGEVFVVPTDN